MLLFPLPIKAVIAGFDNKWWISGGSIHLTTDSLSVERLVRVRGANNWTKPRLAVAWLPYFNRDDETNGNKRIDYTKPYDASNSQRLLSLWLCVFAMPDHGQRKNGILYAHSSFFSFVLCPIRFDGLSIFNGARDGSGASDLALFASRAKKKQRSFRTRQPALRTVCLWRKWKQQDSSKACCIKSDTKHAQMMTKGKMGPISLSFWYLLLKNGHLLLDTQFIPVYPPA